MLRPALIEIMIRQFSWCSTRSRKVRLHIERREEAEAASFQNVLGKFLTSVWTWLDGACRKTFFSFYSSIELNLHLERLAGMEFIPWIKVEMFIVTLRDSVT